MGLKIIPVYESLDVYIKELEDPNADAQALWEKYAIEPIWPKLCEFAPVDMSSRMPKPVGDIGRLKKQVDMLRRVRRLRHRLPDCAAVSQNTPIGKHGGDAGIAPDRYF